MKKSKTPKKTLLSYLLFLLLTTSFFAQVGIGTVTPDASSILDVVSNDRGVLTPRMTTAQKMAIVNPSNGLIVYDTDLKSFYFYDTTSVNWVRVNTNSDGRLKYKLIKSTDVLATVLADELAAGGGAKYLLDSGTLYEINGTINLNYPIEMNNAYISGQDSGEDKLIRTSGDLFTGTTGGSIRILTLSAPSGNVFNIDGAGTASLIFRDSIVASSLSVGSLKNFAIVFLSIVQYYGNANGVVYENVTRLLLSNTGWFSNNTGVYEKLNGTFSLAAKQGGFSEVTGSSIGFDVSSNPVITGDATLESTVFTGTPTTGKYVNPYTVGGYTGYNFNNNWNVRCPGIPTETDASAVGDFAVDYPVGSGASTSFNTSNPSNIVKVQGVSTSTNLFRFSTDGGVNNRLKYVGKKKRIFQVTGSISFQVPAAGTYIIYIAKNATVISQYKIYGRGLTTNDIVVLPLNASVELSSNDYVEVYAQRYTGGTTDAIITPNMTLIVK
ncbi:hypothetical protein [Flavobacterium columnare]|uniref:Cell wall anchor protein n=2 Tax=Flavobacterium columnare TaxID=996 RepID=G8X580_FLACA|nr:hypothetical protein [Flavobacterium columnare]AEW85491.1 hypothetical protein FCOL_03230 [Flavobacterium columnare ATCC 49512]AUX19472.1 hypothetical protein AQ623_07115 [Flavobacterium columnare]QOG57125.1 hypothetical protein HUE29_07040 [Flavobacterium columnare]QOG59849.1 hypothetical protein HUE30_07040 [Flavobacterium columnare]QOG62569.1 hypothetical protein HUE31_07040 [Flavobacterium columnare]